MAESFEKEVWEKLSRIDVSRHVEVKKVQKKDKLTGKITSSRELSYLSWTWAWGVLMSHYPESSYSFWPPDYFKDETVEVIVEVRVKSGDKEIVRRMWLPVMGYGNDSIKNPTSRDISDSRMRCLVKCLAMFGLGYKLYAGEDLPTIKEEKNTISEEQLKNLNEMIQISGADLSKIKTHLNVNDLSELSPDKYKYLEATLRKKIEGN